VGIQVGDYEVSVTQLQEIPSKNMILLVGPPGAGKSTFCHQVCLNTIVMRPVIYLTTESAPSKVLESMREKGLSEALPHALCFVDAFHETVGLPSAGRPDIVDASCEDLTSIGIAISKLQEKMRENVLLIFDSLTSPYFLSGPQVVRFMKLTLSRFAAEGNAVLACIDQGCGKPEDMVTMMSTADGIINIDLKNDAKTFNVLKHPKLRPTKIDIPLTWSTEITYQRIEEIIDPRLLRNFVETGFLNRVGKPIRTETGDLLNVFWPNFIRWSGMLWDPKRFRTLTYKFSKDVHSQIDIMIQFIPWHMRTLLKLLMPKKFSKAKDMKKLVSGMQTSTRRETGSTVEYLEGASKTDEHYFRVHECDTCWGFENVGATLGSSYIGSMAGMFQGLESWRGLERDWNAVETKCIGLGDPYCEFKLVPGQIDELQHSLEAIDNSIVEKVNDRLMDRLTEFLLHEKPLWKERRLGNEISLQEFHHILGGEAVSHASERFRMAMRFGGAMAGKRVGEHLMNMGMKEDEAIKRVLNLLEYCKVGKASMDETIRMKENCESFGMKGKEPSCFFTTGFLNGFFSAVKNQHVKETKCIAMGDPYCEWEFR